MMYSRTQTERIKGDTFIGWLCVWMDSSLTAVADDRPQRSPGHHRVGRETSIPKTKDAAWSEISNLTESAGRVAQPRSACGACFRPSHYQPLQADLSNYAAHMQCNLRGPSFEYLGGIEIRGFEMRIRWVRVKLRVDELRM